MKKTKNTKSMYKKNKERQSKQQISKNKEKQQGEKNSWVYIPRVTPSATSHKKNEGIDNPQKIQKE